MQVQIFLHKDCETAVVGKYTDLRISHPVSHFHRFADNMGKTGKLDANKESFTLNNFVQCVGIQRLWDSARMHQG